MVAHKNIIKGAAHGSSGVSELKTRKAGLLTSAKKAKSTLSLLCAIFSVPFVFSAPSFDFSEFNTNTAVNVLIEKYNGTSTSSFSRDVAFDSVHLLYFNNTFRMSFYASGFQPTIDGFPTRNTQQNYNQFPFKVKALDGSTVYLNYTYFPKVVSIFTFVNTLYRNGYRHGFINSSGENYNIDLSAIVYDLISGTNTVFRSSLVGLLNDLNSTTLASRGLLDSIDSTLVRLSDNYEDVNGVYFSNFTNVLDTFVSFGYLDSSQADVYKDHYSSLTGSDQVNYSDMIRRSLLNSQASQDNISNLMSSSDNLESLKEIGKNLNDDLNNSLNSGFSASAHMQGATTNLLQKMTNMTDQIKKDLEAWRTDSTNRLNQQWAGIKAVETNTHETASGVSAIVNDGVKINGPVEVTIGTDNLNVDIANTDLDSLIGGFADGSDAAMQRWLDEWEMFKDGQLPYMGRFSAFIHDNTNILSSIEKRLDFGFTNTLDATYAFLTNGLESAISNGVAGIGLNLTNELWDYYFDRFQKANEFRDDEGQLFSSIDNQRRIVFGNGFDDSEYKKLDWFSRVELLLYQIGYASTNGTESIEASDLEGEFDDVSDEIQTAASAFEGAARRVVGVFSLVGGFAQAIKNAFSDIAAPSTDGILLLEGGSWIFEEPLVLRIPVLIQNALRLVFQCIWYLSAFVIGWRLVSFAWGRVSSLVRWLWSLIDV